MDVTYLWLPWLMGSYHPRSTSDAYDIRSSECYDPGADAWSPSGLITQVAVGTPSRTPWILSR
jgi:hypothetical protein